MKIIQKKIIFLFLLLLFWIPNILFAQQINQIIRQKDNITREDILVEQELERLSLRQQAAGSKKSFTITIHPPVTCLDQNASMQGKLRDSRFLTLDNIQQSPVDFLLLLELTKAHFDVSRTFYKGGKFIFSNTMRYHSLQELQKYPDDIIKNGVDDVFKSIYYIDYVLSVPLKPLMSKTEKKDFTYILDFLKNPPPSYTHYRFYNEAITDGKKILDTLWERFLKQHTSQLTEKQIKILVAMNLWQEAWIAYQKTTICTAQSKITNPFVDTYEIDLPAYHDSYVLGYGLFKRAEFLTESVIIGDPALTSDERKDFMNLIFDFRKIYPNIIAYNRHNHSLAQLTQTLDHSKDIIKKRFFQ